MSKEKRRCGECQSHSVCRVREYFTSLKSNDHLSLITHTTSNLGTVMRKIREVLAESCHWYEKAKELRD